MEVTKTHNVHHRLSALAFSTLVALASGTPYLYSVYAPQLLKRVGLDTSDSAMISLATNIGCGLGGLPAGIVIDHWGPLFSILSGSLCIFMGYYGLYKIYDMALSNLLVISLTMIIIGFGSILCYFTTIKVAQSNFPNHRGVAGSFPVGAYALSATILSFISTKRYDQNTAGFLRFLSLCCGSIPLVCCYLVRIYNVHEGNDLQDLEEDPILPETSSSFEQNLQNCGPLNDKRNLSSDSLRGSFSFWGIGQRTPRGSMSSEASSASQKIKNSLEQSLLLSSSSQGPGIQRYASTVSLRSIEDAGRAEAKRKTPFTVVRTLMGNKNFLLHYLLVSLTSGIGQMYIYSIGFIVAAQFSYKQDMISAFTGSESIFPLNTLSRIAFQALQVSIVSICSFLGRVLSGFLSDFIYKSFHVQRLWIVSFTIIVLFVGQWICVINVSNKNLVSTASLLIGSAYGLVFGTYPAVIADKFGTRNFSSAWGLICTGPCFILFVLNRYFGKIFDANVDPATGLCLKGNDCYKGVFQLNCILCVLSFLLSFVLLFVQRKDRH